MMPWRINANLNEYGRERRVLVNAHKSLMIRTGEEGGGPHTHIQSTARSRRNTLCDCDIYYKVYTQKPHNGARIFAMISSQPMLRCGWFTGLKWGGVCVCVSGEAKHVCVCVCECLINLAWGLFVNIGRGHHETDARRNDDDDVIKVRNNMRRCVRVQSSHIHASPQQQKKMGVNAAGCK